MISRTIYALLLTTISFACRGQIVFDFSKRTDLDVKELQSKLIPIRHGEFIIFKIENINTFRYKAEIGGKNIEYVTQIPSELQTLFRLPKEEANKDVEETQQGAAMAGGSAHAVGDLNEKLNTELTTNEESLERSGQKEALENLQMVVDKLAEVSEAYADAFENIAKIKFQRMLLINLSKQKWNRFSELEEELPPELSESSMRQNYLKFVGLYAEVDLLFTQAKAIAKANADKDSEELIKEASEQIKKGYNSVDESSFLKIIEDVITLQRALRNRNYFEVVSPPVQMDGDFVEFNINVTPTRVNDLMPHEAATQFMMEVPGRGGWKADFSVGPTLSYGSGARDDDFFLSRNVLTNGDGIPVGIDSVGILTKRTEADRLRPGIAAMIHAYPRSGRQTSLGLMLGVGIGFESLEDADFSFYTGPTLVVGKKQKFMLSGGISYHRVARLKQEFELDQSYSVVDFDANSVTEKFIKPSFFLSLSYAISTRIETK